MCQLMSEARSIIDLLLEKNSKRSPFFSVKKGLVGHVTSINQCDCSNQKQTLIFFFKLIYREI